VAVTIATPSDQKYLDAIERLVERPLPRVPPPEGFALSEAAQKPARKDDDRKPRRGAEKAGRKDRRDRPVKPHGEEAPMTPLEVTTPAEKAAPQVEARTEAKPDTGPERDNRGKGHRKDNRRDHREDRRGGRDDRVVGMGDHMPDFLTRSFKPKAEKADG